MDGVHVHVPVHVHLHIIIIHSYIHEYNIYALGSSLCSWPSVTHFL